MARTLRFQTSTQSADTQAEVIGDFLGVRRALRQGCRDCAAGRICSAITYWEPSDRRFGLTLQHGMEFRVRAPPFGAEALRPLGRDDPVQEAAPAELQRRVVGQKRHRLDGLGPRQKP